MRPLFSPKKPCFTKIANGVTAVVKQWTFYYLFTISLINNLLVLVFGSNTNAVISIIALTAVFVYMEAAVVRLSGRKWLKNVVFGMLCLIHNVLLATDLFLFVKFGKVFNQDIVDILSETNLREAAEFLDTYMQWHIIAVFILSIALINIPAAIFSKKVSRHRIPAFIALFLCTMGIITAGNSALSFALYRNGMSVPQYTAVTRTAHSVWLLHKRMNSIISLTEANKQLLSRGKNKTDIKTEHKSDSTLFVFVIGESFSVYHSSLFNYDKNTNPKLKKRLDNGELIVFDNAVTIDDHTHGVMKSIFSLSEKGNNFDEYPLFPTVFKAAGYRTSLYDNQYFAGNGVTFLSNKELSAIMFDERNSKRFQYDGELIASAKIPDKNENSLIIFHLMGQHYTYADRYPHKDFSIFTPNQYTGNEEQREIKAHYDNATVYNDAVIDTLIKRLVSLNACMVYVSDHGEEVFEQSDYMGHGNSSQVKDLRFQMRVPLIIWCSESFKTKNEGLWNKLSELAHCPVFTDDMPHLLLDMAGIKTEKFDSTRSFVNNSYRKDRHRIILNSIDYDEIK